MGVHVSQDRSGTATKALALLALLGEHAQGATAGDVARAAGYPLSTAYRLLNTLVDAGFAEYEEERRRYRLGPRVFQLGQKVAHARGFDGTAGPILRRLTEQTQESSIFHILDDGCSLTVHKVDGPQFRTTTDPGDRVPLHTSASGKVLLAYSEARARDYLLAAMDFHPRTGHSVGSRGELELQLEAVRRQGWAAQSEENDPGMAAISVPVPSARGALTLAAPVFRAGVEDLHRHLPVLLEAADQLSLQLPQRG